MSVAVLDCTTVVTPRPARKAVKRLLKLFASTVRRLSPKTRSTPVRTMWVPQTSRAMAASRLRRWIIESGQAQGSEYVLVLVKLFMASWTPSLYPNPESLMPPNGVNSRR